MRSVGIRELKQRASELVRQVRERGNPIEITYHGKVVALLVPVEPSSEPETEIQAWAALDELAAQVGKAWPPGIQASQAVTEQRR